MLGNGKVLNEVLITARHDCVEVSVLNHTTISVMLESLSFSTVQHMDLLRTLLPSYFCLCGVMIGHWPYLPKQKSDTSQMCYASK